MHAGEIRAAIEQYGRAFIMPPTLDDEKHLTKVQVEHTEYLTWHVTAPLWTVEEGRSDLEIQLLIELGDKAPQIEICNVRVP